MFAHITRLPRPARYWQAPRCHGEVKDGTKRWRDHAGRDYRCDRKAIFEVDGRKLCQLHAGDVLIERALRQMEGDDDHR